MYEMCLPATLIKKKIIIKLYAPNTKQNIALQTLHTTISHHYIRHSHSKQL